MDRSVDERMDGPRWWNMRYEKKKENSSLKNVYHENIGNELRL